MTNKFSAMACVALAIALSACGGAGVSALPVADTQAEINALNSPSNAKLNIDLNDSKDISKTLFGIFFEDINYAGDGGLYAELIRNRDFEFSPAIGDDRRWNAKTAWRLDGDGTTFDIAEDNPISKNNKHYAVLETKKAGGGLVNEGFRGIPVVKNAKYDFSVFAKNFSNGTQPVTVKLIDNNGKVYGTAKVNVSSKDWKKLSATITANDDCKSAHFLVMPEKEGKIGLDMVSLFPQDTFKGRKNGLRKDLAQKLADLKPTFIRFPGGCVAHGDLPRINGQAHSGLIENAPNNDVYYWKDSVGKLEDRLPIHNRWGYHQTRGLGYYEYMQFCEDIGASPLPILPCGVDCQFSGGQQAVPLDEMQLEIDNVLDLIEFANGSTSTKWGKVRAEMGHPKSFNLKFIGLGNEEQMSEAFFTRFKMVFDAVKAKHPEITVVGTVGPSADGREFENGWAFARRENVPIVDEHFYRDPNWFVNNGYHRYDKYDRKGPKVYAGEYAAHESGQQGPRRNTMETALDEAVFLTGVERNGDVVVMTSYAPLFSKQNDTQWHPDMIIFNNNEIIPTTTYEVHKLFSANAGSKYINNSMVFEANAPANYERNIVASVVRDGNDGKGDIIIKLVNVSTNDFVIDVNLQNVKEKFQTKAISKSITGTWKNTDFKLTENAVKVGNNFKVALKSRSMKLIRIPVK